MRYVLWVVGFLLFAFMLTFAVKNTDAVAVRYFLIVEKLFYAMLAVG